MDIRNLNTFLHVAELGSFSRAGERLGYSQPTVSVQIRQLEQELGERLFDRIGHTVRLTDKGRETLAYAQQICRLCQELTRDSVQQTDAMIRLATADSLCFPLMGREFAAIRSSCGNLRLHLTTAGTTELFRMLDQNEVDLVCTLDSRIYNTNYIIAGEERVGVHFVVPTSHPLAKKEKLIREDVLAQPFLLTEKGMSYRRLLDQWLAEEALELRPVLESGRADLLCALVEEGQGVSFLPDYVTREAVQRGTVVLLDAEDFHPMLWKQLLYHRDKWLSRPLQAVIDHLVQVQLAGGRE